MKLDTHKIKLLMVDHEINQSTLAERCGIARQNISAMLARGTCSITNVGKIAKALGVDPAEIVKEEA